MNYAQWLDVNSSLYARFILYIKEAEIQHTKRQSVCVPGNSVTIWKCESKSWILMGYKNFWRSVQLSPRYVITSQPRLTLPLSMIKMARTCLLFYRSHN